MNIEKVINDITSKESQQIREAGAEIIRNSQNEEVIKSLIPYLNKIKRETNGLELGGAFATNNRFYKFPIEIIEFHKNLKSFGSKNEKCTCELYLSKTYEGFNPEKEAENQTIQLNIKIKGNWTQDYEMQCLKCQKKYHVSERHYHFIWWKWEPLKYERQIPISGNSNLDDEFKLLIKVVQNAIDIKNINKDALIFEKERLMNFRMKLAYHKATEFIETKYGWNEIFDEMINDIEQRIKKEA